MVQTFFLLLFFLVCSCENKPVTKYKLSASYQFDRYEEKNCNFERVTYHYVIDFSIDSKLNNDDQPIDIKYVKLFVDDEYLMTYYIDHLRAQKMRTYYYIKNIFGKERHYEYFEHSLSQSKVDYRFYFYPKVFLVQGVHDFQFKFYNEHNKVRSISNKHRVKVRKKIDTNNFVNFNVKVKNKKAFLNWKTEKHMLMKDLHAHIEYGRNTKKRYFLDFFLKDKKKTFVLDLPEHENYLAFYFSWESKKDNYENKIVVIDSSYCPGVEN